MEKSKELINLIISCLETLDVSKLERVYKTVSSVSFNNEKLKLIQEYSSLRSARNRLYSIVMFGNYSPSFINMKKEELKDVENKMSLLREKINKTYGAPL